MRSDIGLSEVSLLDASGKILLSEKATSSEDWKPVKQGGMMQRLLNAALGLPPFGSWEVVAYRSADGAAVESRLVGSKVRFADIRADVGTKSCSATAYQSKPMDAKEFSRYLGISLESIGIKTPIADAITVKCEASDWSPPQSLLVKLPEGRMLMLWEGVFLELKGAG